MNSLVYLRRMIINQKPARIDYTVYNKTKSQYYERAGFEGSHDEVAKNLRDILESKSVKVVTSDDVSPMSNQRVFAPKAIASMLSGYTFDAEMRAALLSFTMRLPPLIVRLYPMQRYAFQDNSAYMKMHMQYQHDGMLRMQNYISQAENARDEMARLRVLTATYFLCLIAPLNAVTKTHISTQQVQVHSRNNKKKVSLLSRIINRIRGL